MTTTTNQTARNNVSLRAIREWMNGTIYFESVRLMNNGVRAAVAAFIGTYVHAECRAERVAAIMGGELPDR